MYQADRTSLRFQEYAQFLAHERLATLRQEAAQARLAALAREGQGAPRQHGGGWLHSLRATLQHAAAGMAAAPRAPAA